MRMRDGAPYPRSHHGAMIPVLQSVSQRAALFLSWRSAANSSAPVTIRPCRFMRIVVTRWR
jgi:hypothetical protein